MPDPVAPPDAEAVTPVIASPTIEELRSLMTGLADARHAADVAWLAYATRRADLLATIDDLDQQAMHTKELVGAYEFEAKRAVLAFYEQTKERKPVAGAEVKVGKLIAVDIPAALALVTKLGLQQYVNPATLKVDEFAKVAPSLAPDLVKITDDPKVTLSRNLDAALGIERPVAEVAP